MSNKARLKNKKVDVVIIGGGFYGCMLALYFKKIFKNVIILEKESDLFLKASYNNQARIHNGYHYPRSFITALRSHINYDRFISDFKNCVEDDFQMVYGIAMNNSKVTASQFLKFCKQIGSPIIPAPSRIKELFNRRLIEDVFLVEEAVFNAAKLRNILKEKLKSLKIKVKYLAEVTRVEEQEKGVLTRLRSGEYINGSHVFNCSYSGINNIICNSNLTPLPFKHELTQMPLLEVPLELKKVGITIIDGPFFSIMPFPDRKLHTLHHVRYTPLISQVGTNKKNISQAGNDQSNILYMIKDAQRFVPLLKDVKYKGSLYEVKTILTVNESSDARPILFKQDYQIENFHVVMGGKIDNIYDIISTMKKAFKQV